MCSIIAVVICSAHLYVTLVRTTTTGHPSICPNVSMLACWGVKVVKYHD